MCENVVKSYVGGLMEGFTFSHISGISKISQSGVNPWVKGKNLSFSKIFAKNCRKMEEIGPRRGGVPGAPLDPPMDFLVKFTC